MPQALGTFFSLACESQSVVNLAGGVIDSKTELHLSVDSLTGSFYVLGFNLFFSFSFGLYDSLVYTFIFWIY